MKKKKCMKISYIFYKNDNNKVLYIKNKHTHTHTHTDTTIMEMQPVLSIFPYDVSFHIYNKLCILKRLPNDLNTHILIFHSIYDIILYYKSLFSNDPVDDDYYLFWLENDLVLYLNNNLPTMYGVSTELKKEHPFITSEFLEKKIPVHELSSRIFKLWCLLNLTKQIQFIRSQCNGMLSI